MVDRKRMIGWTLGILVNTLLNMIDAIAIGPLFFSSADPFFGQFSLDGIGLYLMTTSAAQLILPLFTSFRGAVAAGMMAECFPFINQIVSTVSDQNPGQDNVKIATVLMAFVVHTLTISAAFFLLAALHLDRVAQKCPKQVLLGAMGGIGAFLLKTALEQGIGGAIIGSAVEMKQVSIVAAGAVPAILTIWTRRRNRVKSPFLVPIFLISVIILFYSVALPLGYSVEALRKAGWIIEGPTKDGLNPFRIYGFFSWNLVNWTSVASCWSTYLSSAAFAMLQLPINVPSFGRSTKQPASLRAEFLANSVINLVTSLVGMLPSYFMYTPSVLLVQAGADHHYCSYGLALTTGFSLFFGLFLIAYIPIPAVLFLLFYLGFELILEATVDSRRFALPKDSLQIGAMMVMMAWFGFAQGLLFGLVISFLFLFWERRSLPRSVRSLDLVYLIEGWQDLVRYGPVEDAFLAPLRAAEMKCAALPSFYSFANLLDTAEAMKSLLCDDLERTRYVIIDLSKAASRRLGMGLLEMVEEVLMGDLSIPWIGSIVIVSPSSDIERCKRLEEGRDGLVKVVTGLIDAVVWIDRIMMLELDIDIVVAPSHQDEPGRSHDDLAPLLIQSDNHYQNHHAILSKARSKSIQASSLESQCLEALGPLETVTVPSGTILWHPKEHLKAIYILTSPSSLIVELSESRHQVRRWGGGRAWLGVPQVMMGQSDAAEAETNSTCVVLTDSRLMILPDSLAHRHASSIKALFPDCSL